MKPRMRGYQGEEDFWKVRGFLRHTMLLNDLKQLNWPVARWDYWRWHGILNCGMDPLEGSIYIWETPEGEIAAVINPEERGWVFFHVHPAYRTEALEREMLAAAEKLFTLPGREGRVKLRIHAHENDLMREKILQENGYTLGKGVDTQNHRLVSLPVPDVPIAEGFTIRSLGDKSELPARSWASWRGFHPNEPDEKYEGWEWYFNIQRCPLYRRDLDIVAVAPNGDIASFCTIWYDDVTRTAYYEPVATPPEYQRKGLARACMMEGLRRLQSMGCVQAIVVSGEPAAQQFYHTIGFNEHEIMRGWVKEF